MNKFKILISGFAIVMAMSSCDDLLNTKPLDSYSDDLIWSDYKLVEGVINNAYKDIVKEYIYTPLELDAYYGAANDDYSDNIIISTNNVVTIIKDQMTPDKDYRWSTAFPLIRQANLIIENVGKSDFPDNIKKEMIAEGKMLRAMIYFNKARLFGKFVLIDKVLTPEDELQLGRSKTIKETYDFILKDLKDAASGLPENAENGYFTKGAALALKAEVALHGASYIETGKEDYYKEVKTSSEELFKLGYSLDSDYKKMFNDYDYASNSKEIIFALWRNKSVTQYKDTPMQQFTPNAETNVLHDFAWPKLKQNFLGWGNRWPSQDLVDEYEVIDRDGKAKKWNETSYYEDYINNPGTYWVSDHLYKHRDQRFYASIAYDSTYIYENLVVTRITGNMHRKSLNKASKLSTRTGYFVRKTLYEKEPIFAQNYTDYHHVILRLGRSYLNYAEACLRLNEKDKAIEYINKTRTLHGGLPAHTAAAMTLDDAWKAYKSERRVELFFEGDRYWSLIRWGKADGLEVIPELNHAFQTLEIAADGHSYEMIDVPDVHGLNSRAFSAKRYLFLIPIPQMELNKNLANDQNPGWN